MHSKRRRLYSKRSPWRPWTPEEVKKLASRGWPEGWVELLDVFIAVFGLERVELWDRGREPCKWLRRLLALLISWFKDPRVPDQVRKDDSDV